MPSVNIRLRDTFRLIFLLLFLFPSYHFFPSAFCKEACAHGTLIPGWRGSSGLANNQLSLLCWSEKLGLV